MVSSTDQADDCYDRCIPRSLAIAGNVQMPQRVSRPQGRTPMHSRHGAGEDEGAADSPRDRVGPGIREDEEERQSCCTSRRGNDSRADDVGNVVTTAVVADGRVAEVVHAADSTA